jgi:hypothetical protein
MQRLSSWLKKDIRQTRVYFFLMLAFYFPATVPWRAAAAAPDSRLRQVLADARALVVADAPGACRAYAALLTALDHACTAGAIEADPLAGVTSELDTGPVRGLAAELYLALHALAGALCKEAARKKGVDAIVLFLDAEAALAEAVRVQARHEGSLTVQWPSAMPPPAEQRERVRLVALNAQQVAADSTRDRAVMQHLVNEYGAVAKALPSVVAFAAAQVDYWLGRSAAAVDDPTTHTWRVALDAAQRAAARYTPLRDACAALEAEAKAGVLRASRDHLRGLGLVSASAEATPKALETVPSTLLESLLRAGDTALVQHGGLSLLRAGAAPAPAAPPVPPVDDILVALLDVSAADARRLPHADLLRRVAVRAAAVERLRRLTHGHPPLSGADVATLQRVMAVPLL